MTLTMDTTSPTTGGVDSGVPGERLTELGANLRHALDGQLADERATARSRFPAEHLHRAPGQTMEQAREWVLNRLREIDASGFGSAGLIRKAGDAPDPAAAVVAFEMLSLGDLSTLIKSGVQFGLVGGAVSNLGTSWHHDTFMPDITSLKLLGCFAMSQNSATAPMSPASRPPSPSSRRPTSSRSTPRPPRPRRPTSAAPPATGRWLSSSGSCWCVDATTACTSSSSPSATPTATTCPA